MPKQLKKVSREEALALIADMLPSELYLGSLALDRKMEREEFGGDYAKQSKPSKELRLIVSFQV